MHAYQNQPCIIVRNKLYQRYDIHGKDGQLLTWSPFDFGGLDPMAIATRFATNLGLIIQPLNSVSGQKILAKVNAETTQLD